jgi:hypothetical protein
MKRPQMVQKGYYTPLALANGVDFCLVDFTGSMAFKDQVRGLNSYWYKKGRPNRGDPLAIVKPFYAFLSDKGAVEIGNFEQDFDADSGILATHVSGFQIGLDIKTFLTPDHALVELYEVTDCTAQNGKLAFTLRFFPRCYTNKPIQNFVSCPDAVITGGLEDDVPTFRYTFDDSRDRFQGKGISEVRVLSGNARVVPVCEGGPALPERMIGSRVEGLHAGCRLIRVTAVIDSLDTDDWEEAIRIVRKKYLDAPAGAIEAAYRATRATRISNAAFTCSNDAIGDLFKMAKYVCDAAHHPNGSSVSALGIPNDHCMGTYWDVWYVHRALLAANMVEAAARTVRFWEQVYPFALRFAKSRYGVGGARFPWVTNYKGEMIAEGEQIHNNLIPVLNIWDQYAYSGDLTLLERNFDLMQDAVRFVIEDALRQEDDGRWYLKAVHGPDESPTPKRNELLVTAAAMRCIGLLETVARLIGRNVDAQIVAAKPGFQAVLHSLHGCGFYQIYENAVNGGWATVLAYLHLPCPAEYKSAVDFALAGATEQAGLGAGSTSRMRCATFPWIEGVFAWSMARNRDPRCWDYIEKMTRFTNFYGGLPEYLYVHGEPSREWFVAAHGVFIAALAEACVQSDDNTLELLPPGIGTVPWATFSVKDIRVPGGFLIQMTFERGNRLAFRIQGTLARQEPVTVKLGEGYCRRVALNAGETFEDTVTL